jgi:hypothetical protein
MQQLVQHTKNIRDEFVIKCLFLAVGLALFAAPLSHKFYLYASQQSFRAGNPHHQAGERRFSAAALGDHQQCRLLSLDKRYDLKQPFGTIFPFLSQFPLPVRKINRLPTWDDYTFSRTTITFYLRGPPGFPFFG